MREDNLPMGRSQILRLHGYMHVFRQGQAGCHLDRFEDGRRHRAGGMRNKRRNCLVYFGFMQFAKHFFEWLNNVQFVYCFSYIGTFRLQYYSNRSFLRGNSYYRSGKTTDTGKDLYPGHI